MAARARTSGGAGAAIGMGIGLTVLALWALVATTFAVMYAINQKELMDKADAAEAEAAKLISPGDKDDAEIQELVKNASASNTAVAQIYEELRKLRGIITGSPNSDLAKINSDLASNQYELSGQQRELNQEGAGLIQDIETLKNKIDEKRVELSETTRKLEATEEKLAQKDRQIAEFTDTKATLAEKNTQTLKNQAEQFQKQITKLQEELNRADEKVTRANEKREKEITELQAKLGEAERTIRDLEIKLADTTARKPAGTDGEPNQEDGEILDIFASEQKVFIDLGKKDGLLSGLTFSVYDQRTGIPKRDPEKAVKAIIEVYKVNDQTAEARIVKKYGRSQIQKGDIIANTVYHRGRSYNFVVHGKFDLDNEGFATDEDRARIKKLIGQWNGTVMDEVTPQTDFLVLGEEPLSPGEIDPNNQTIAEQIRTRELRKQYDAYQNLIAEARRNNVPILNQNRFLALLGYYQR